MAKFKDLSKEDIVSKILPSRNITLTKKNLNLYCYDCKCLICRDCIMLDHSNRKLGEFNDNVANKKRENSCRGREAPEAQGNDVAKTIDSSFDEFHTKLEGKKEKNQITRGS